MPLEQAKQPYSYLPVAVRRSLKDLLTTNGPDYGLPDFLEPAFVRIIGYNTSISSTDAALCLQSALDCSGPSHAYDVLSDESYVKSLPTLRSSMQLVLSAGSRILEKQAVTTYKHFRFCYLHPERTPSPSSVAALKQGASGLTGETVALARPQVVGMLGRWLVRSSKAWKGRKAKPLLVLTLIDEKTYRVTHFNCVPEGEVANNRFLKRFQMAAEQVGGKREKVWDDQCWEVEKDKIGSFLGQVHLILEQ